MPPPDAPLSPAPGAPVPPVAPVVVTKRRAGGRWVDVLLGVAAVIAVGGVAFAIGRSTAPASAAAVLPGGIVVDGGPIGSFDPNTLPGGGPAGGPGLLGGGPTIQGTVTAVDADSIAITLASGDEVTFAIDGDTTYHVSTAADPGSVEVGDDVAIQADGGRFTFGGNGQGNPGQGADPGSGGDGNLTAADVTVRR